MRGLTREQIRALIPHAGAMCLLDSVIEWDHAGIHCRSESHRREHHPLRRNGCVAAVHLVEYAAQAAAVHAGLLARESGDGPPPGGFLAGVREVELAEQSVDSVMTPLDIRVHRQLGGAQGVIYRFVVDSAGAVQSSGQLTIVSAA